MPGLELTDPKSLWCHDVSITTQRSFKTCPKEVVLLF